MLSLFRTLSLRHLRRHWPRAALVVLSIALGVATLVATRLLNQSMTAAARNSVTPLAGVGDLLVSNGDAGVSGEAASRLEKAAIPGVQSVAPLVFGRVALPELDNRPAFLLGIDLDAAARQSANPWGIEIRWTNPLGFLTGGKPILVGSALAADLSRSIPSGIGGFRVRAGGKERRLSAAGTVEARGPAAVLGGSVIVMHYRDAAALLGQPGLVSRIDLVLEPGADRGAVQSRVGQLLSGVAEVRTPEGRDQGMQDVMAGPELGFALGGAGALVVGLFLVYNAFSVSVAERRHDIGVWRALGATRGQVAGLFAGEAALLGLLGAALGVPAGWGLACASLGPIQRTLGAIFGPLEAPAVEVRPVTVLLAVLAGLITALLAALVPALQAARQEPAEAVRRLPRIPGWLFRALQTAASGLLILGGLALFAVRRQWPDRVGTFGAMVLVLLGALVAMPVLTAAAARLVQPAARRCLGIAGRLAADNLARSPGRTGLVVGALAAAVALLIQTAGVTASSERAVLGWLDDSFGADLYVTGNTPLSAGAESLPMGEEVGRRIAALPEVESVVAGRFQRVDFRDKMVFLVAIDAVAFHQQMRGRRPVPGLELYPRLAEPGTALVSENFAALHDVAVGDTISVRGPHGPVPLRIVGMVLDYSWNRGTVLVEREHYRGQFDDPLVDVVDVFVRPGEDAGAVRETILRRWGAEEALAVITRDELCGNILGAIRRLYGIAYAQELIIGAVAALGVVTALLISVLHRQRELGLLRAVGASRAQVLWSVLAEATLMGLIGAVLGLLVGVPLEWYVVRVMILEETGFLFPVRVPWAEAGAIASLAVLLATLAGLGPALHAVRLRIPEAIAYE
jgi:putative ABC transport system permease protein